MSTLTQMPPGDPLEDLYIGDYHDALVRRAEAGQGEALAVIFGVLEFGGRHDWYITAPDVLSRLGINYHEVTLDDGAAVARAARAFRLREELATADALEVIEREELS